MVEEVRRQFREIPGILDGNATPEYAKCVDIATIRCSKRNDRSFIISIILVPIVTGFILSIAGVLGLINRWSYNWVFTCCYVK